jgi:hypothetical protein
MLENRGRARALLFICMAAYFTISVVFLLIDRTGATSDTKFYLTKADECIQNGVAYPGRHNEFDNYVQNPGYINYLILLKRLGFSLKGAYFLNILLSMVLLILLYLIAETVFGQPLYSLPVIFFLFPRNYAMNLDLYSDLLSAVMAYLCIFLFLKKKRSLAFLSGLILSAANFVRPEAAIFIVSILAYAAVVRIPRARVALFLAAFLAGVLVIGFINRARTGHFVFQSVTGGINLLLGANPDANGKGEIYPVVFQPGKAGYIPNASALSYVVKDRYWWGQAVRWIKEHPLRYVYLAIPKVYYTFRVDSWGINKLANTNVQRRELSTLPRAQKSLLLFVQLLNQTAYALILALALISVKRLLQRREAWLLAFIVISGAGFIGLLVGDTRMKYPLLPALLVLAAFSADALLARCLRCSRKPPVGFDR